MALAFRQQIFAWLVVIAVVPAAIAVTVVVFAPRYAAPVGGTQAWEEAATSWRILRRGIKPEELSPGTRLALERHGDELALSLRRAKQSETLNSLFTGVLAGAALSLAVLVFGGAVRLAGHLSRQLSRPIDELVAWTRHIEQGERLPDTPPPRGAQEFTVLRERLRAMSATLERARMREIEAAELRAFRELASQVAHELKNPLTPMRFALQRLAKSAPADQKELIDVLDTESRRLEQMARDFGELGRLPEGPTAPVDLAELCDELARGAPEGVTVTVDKTPAPHVSGHYEPLRRALQNFLLNAVDAVSENGVRGAGRGEIMIGVKPAENGEQAVEVTVRDNGVGISGENLARIFEPRFTTKAHGTGLGLAIARQTVIHHGGSIAVASEPGRGSTFTIILPCGGA